MAPSGDRGPIPERIRVIMHQAGFGEAMMVSFLYAEALEDGRSERHILLDFGSTHAPKGVSAPLSALFEPIAERIAEQCSGRLDAVVATHRHADHIAGFGVPAAAHIIASLQPRLVLRPWTEDPAVPADATGPASAQDQRSGLAPEDLRLRASLAGGQELAARIRDLVGELAGSAPATELLATATAQLANHDAVAFLDDLAGATRAVYASAGAPSGLEDIIPGIRVRVLGPPTLRQRPDIVKARSSDPEEFWMLHLAALVAASPERLGLAAPTRPPGVEPGPVGWLVDHLARQQLDSLMRVVHTVDDALNNTSLILLIDAGDKRLLLPGDAQIENWSWALRGEDAAELSPLLADVDLYKVGHHGSRNGTPRSLFALWGIEPDPARPMAAVMSTMPGVHGKSEATAVPRATLVAALEHRMQTFLRTDDDCTDVEFAAVEAPAAGREPFRALPAGALRPVAR